MSKNAELGGFPQWLVNVGIVVDELIQYAETMKRFREHLRRWTEHHLKNEEPVELLPNRAMNRDETHAMLAAVHDVTCQGAKRIDLWRVGSRRSEWRKHPARCKGAIPYVILCRKVSDLRAGDRARIEGLLKDVGGRVIEHKRPRAKSRRVSLHVYQVADTEGTRRVGGESASRLPLTTIELPKQGNGGRRGKKHKPDAGNKVQSKVTREFVKAWVRDHDYASLKDLSAQLKKQDAKLAVSPTTLCRWGYGKQARTGNPRRSIKTPAKEVAKGLHEREPVAGEEVEPLEYYAMPDDCVS